MKIYIDTLGCPKNMNDSENAAGVLERAGHSITDEITEAEAVMINTCGFINDAKRESIDRIFEAAQIKNKDAILIVSGCLSQRYGGKLYKEMPEVDIFTGVNDYSKLPDILSNYRGGREKHFSPCAAEYEETGSRRFAKNPYSATLKIAEGCDNVCAYCVIPSIRGGYRSRKREHIIAEAASLAERGCRELLIIAQDVTAYGADIYGKYELPGLLRELCGIDGLRWIRLMYCYEDRITDELIETIRSEEKICNYIDMPLQHCSDKILNAMNRRSTKKSIEATVKRLREAVPDIHIRTTLITGFPGEGAEEFAELADFVQRMRFERLGIFAYSKEEGTPAAKMKPQVRANVKESRRNLLMQKQLDISLERNTAKIGDTIEVIAEGRDGDGAFYGRSRYDAPEIDNAVIFTSDRKIEAGDIVNVEITDAFDYDLTGREALNGGRI